MLLDPEGNALSSGWALSSGGLVVPEDYVRPWPVAVDLFAGCGGFSLGMHQAGFHVAAAVELDFPAAVTYLVNLARPGVQIHFDTPEREAEFEAYLVKQGVRDDPSHRAGSGWISGQPLTEPGCEHFWIADARTLRGDHIRAELGVDEVDCVFGGPPCQGFSQAGRRNVMDPRNSLVMEFARLVLEIRPRTMVMENVPGILSMVTPEGAPVMDVLCETLEEGGFGTFDALRQALTGEPTRRAVARGAGKKSRRPRRQKPDNQGELFAAGGAA